MKVLYIDQSGQLGGGEIALLPWLREVRNNAQVVLFEDGPFRTALEASGIPVEVLSTETLKDVRRESGLRSLLVALPAFVSLRSRLARRARGSDVLYANSQKAFLVAALAKGRRQPLVWHLRDILSAEHFSRVLRTVAVFAGNHFASVIIANSRATAEAFVTAGGHRSKLVVVHDGVNSEPFDSAGTTSLRTALGVPHQPLVGLFGRLSPWKGQHIFLDALSAIPDAHGVLVGDALFGEGDYAEELKVRASKPDLAGRIHFLGFRHDVAALMRGVDIIVHTSTSAEPFGLVIVEGMLARKPVIATAAGGALEIIESGKTGLLVESGSVSALREALTGLLADTEGAKRLAQAGRQRAEMFFSLSALFGGLSAVLARYEPASSKDSPPV